METPILETPTSANRMGRDPFATKSAKPSKGAKAATARVLKTGEGKPTVQTASTPGTSTEEGATFSPEWIESTFALPLQGIRFGVKSWLVARYLLTHREEWHLG